MTAYSGGCLCGAVRFTVSGPFQRFALCYCSRCRKATGSAHASNLFTEAGNVEWLAGRDLLRRHELEGAERFSRTFCTTCGSPVPCVSRDGRRLLVPAGCLDEGPGIPPGFRIYLADRPAWAADMEAVQGFEGARPE